MRVACLSVQMLMSVCVCVLCVQARCREPQCPHGDALHRAPPHRQPIPGHQQVHRRYAALSPFQSKSKSGNEKGAGNRSQTSAKVRYMYTCICGRACGWVHCLACPRASKPQTGCAQPLRALCLRVCMMGRRAEQHHGQVHRDVRPRPAARSAQEHCHGRRYGHVPRYVTHI
jgi:hypothetical protein